MRPLQPGLTLRSYRLEHLLGFGASGQVWLAKDQKGREVALKARPREGGHDEQRLRQEFEKLRTLRLPGVVRVLDAGADQGYVFFTMDVARGQAFDAYVAEGDSLSARVERAAGAGAQVARALAAIHRLGLAHRDVKPANIMVDDHGRAIVLDFGTLRFGAGADTSSGFAGTVAYMAPEQRVGLPHDHRVDAYALGVTLHQALSGQPAGRWKPGRPRPTLATLGPDVPLGLAWLVDRLLSLDPAQRPSAEEAESVLAALAVGDTLAPVPWPAPAGYAGDPSPLLRTSAVVVGRLGSGRRRMVQEARWQWYRKGYRSVAGRCEPDRPYGALRDVLAELFADRDQALRARLAGTDASTLRALWPDLPVAVDDPAPSPVDPLDAARALAGVLQRAAPLAVVLWELDDADAGTAAVLQQLPRILPDRLLLWATARTPAVGLRQLSPPPWTPADERSVLPDLLPPGVWPEGPPGETPLESCAKAWRALARWRGGEGPPEPLPPGLDRLSVLDEPFPYAVARSLVPQVNRLLADGHLVARAGGGRTAAPTTRRLAEGDDEVTETSGLFDRTRPVDDVDALGPAQRLAFADRGTRRLARAALDRPDLAHAAAAAAWRAFEGDPERARRVARHALRAGAPQADDFSEVVRLELDRGNPGEVDRWLRLHALHFGRSDRFFVEFARMYADAELRPGSLRRDAIKALGRRAATAEERGMAGYLLLMHDARAGDRPEAIDRGTRWARALSATQPAIAAGMMREVALARLAGGDSTGAVGDCRAALTLAREAARREAAAPVTDAADADAAVPLTRAEVNVATTLSAGLIYSGKLREAAEFCEGMARRCHEAGLHRGEGAMLANLALTRFHIGEREAATEAAARCRAVQPRHRDPVVAAVCVNLQARLAIELGDLSAGRPLLDEAMTAGQALGMGRLMAETWASVLDAALQRFDHAEARRALLAYGSEGASSDLDHWPAALARWLWYRGDLAGALRATEEPREGHAGLLVEAERARVLLLLGRYEESARFAEGLRDRARGAEMHEIARFASLVRGAAAAVPDAEYLPLLQQTRDSRWVHLYLGALHLDAVRRRLRGEHVGHLVRRLRARASDVDHCLYVALAREEAW